MSGVTPIPHFVAVFFFSLLIITIFFLSSITHSNLPGGIKRESEKKKKKRKRKDAATYRDFKGIEKLYVNH